jgi:hypothetical protein
MAPTGLSRHRTPRLFSLLSGKALVVENPFR